MPAPVPYAYIYSNDGTTLLKQTDNDTYYADTPMWSLKADGIYYNNVLWREIKNFLGLAIAPNQIEPSTEFIVPSSEVALNGGSETLTRNLYIVQNSNIQINITENGTLTLATKGTRNEGDIAINVNITSSGSDEETIYTEINAMTFGSTRYNVLIPTGYPADHYYYSLDNGLTWISFPLSSAGSTIVRTSQIKFKAHGDSSTLQYNIHSAKLGVNISSSASDSISDNYVLTQNIDDINAYMLDLCCFVAGTPVLMTNNVAKNIEDIKIGDNVVAYNEDTKEFESHLVTRTIIKENTIDLATIVLSDNTTISFNAYHPFLTNEGWKSITHYNGMPELKVGDILVSTSKNIIIKNIERKIIEPIVTYNLEIDVTHNYLVGNNSTYVVVHNIACPTL